MAWCPAYMAEGNVANLHKLSKEGIPVRPEE